MFVSQKIFLKDQEGKILILRRSDTHPSMPLEWDLPGGVVEEGENLKDQILRELREETGIEIGDVKVIGAESAQSKKGEYVVQIAYSGAVDKVDIVLSYEHSEYKWVSQSEFLEVISAERLRHFLEVLI